MGSLGSLNSVSLLTHPRSNCLLKRRHYRLFLVENEPQPRTNL